MDISEKLDKLRVKREETPAAAAVPSCPPKKSNPTTATIKEAKKEEFPVAPEKKKMTK